MTTDDRRIAYLKAENRRLHREIEWLRTGIEAIGALDWVTLLALGGPSDDFDFRAPGSFDTEGDYETDARHVYPERTKLVRRACDALLDRPAEVTP